MGSDLEKPQSTLITAFQFLDSVIDLCSGMLMIFLFGPIFYATHYGFLSASARELLFKVFPDFFRLFTGLSLSSLGPWLVLTIALVLGFVARAVLVIHNFLPLKWFEKWLARRAFGQVRKWHGLSGNWDDRKIISELIDRNPFHEVGDPDYAVYRGTVENPEGSLRSFKAYWDYEALVFMRSSHIYGIFLTFSITYFLYGLCVFGREVFPQVKAGIPPMQFIDPLLWIGIVALFFGVTICLLEEALIHGVAFIVINKILRSRSMSVTPIPPK